MKVNMKMKTEFKGFKIWSKRKKKKLLTYKEKPLEKLIYIGLIKGCEYIWYIEN